VTVIRDDSYRERDVRVVFAAGALARLGEEIGALGATRLFIVSTPGRAAIVETARAILTGRARGTDERDGEGVVAGVFDGAVQHVPRDLVGAALEAARSAGADGFLAIGGGSAIGLGKALARETGLPLAAMPTTYSGSEMTDIWGIAEGDRKRTGRDPAAVPRLVLYDPELTATMPAAVAAASGMNAIAHGVEALYSPTGGELTRLFAAEGIRRVAASLPVLASLHAPERSGAESDAAASAARRDAMWGAHLCGRALDMASMGIHHRLCHALGGLGLPHARTHAIVLPYATAYNAPGAPDAMAAIADSLRASGPADGHTRRVGGAAAGLWALNRALGISDTLADLGLAPGSVDRVVEEVMSRPFPNPVPVTAEGIRAILGGAMSGGPPPGAAVRG